MERQCKVVKLPRDSRNMVDPRDYCLFVVYQDDMPIDVIVRLSNKSVHPIPNNISEGWLENDEDGLITFRYKDKRGYSAHIQLSEEAPKIKHKYINSMVSAILDECGLIDKEARVWRAVEIGL